MWLNAAPLFKPTRAPFPSSSPDGDGEVPLRHLLEPDHQALPEPAVPVGGRRGGSELGFAGLGCPKETHLRHHQCPGGNPAHLQEVQEQHPMAVSVTTEHLRLRGSCSDSTNAFFSRSGNRVDAALVSRHKELQREVCDLTEAEEQLDELISKCNLQLRLLTEEPQNKKYPFRPL